jgi:Ner family transcriptional regulator
MTQTRPAKKPVDQLPLEDWHWADVLAGLRKRGWSLRQVGLDCGYADGNALGEVARRPWPKGEKIIAAYLGKDHPKEIWPSRYDAEGNPNRRHGRAPMRGQKPCRKATTGLPRCNPQKAASA